MGQLAKWAQDNSPFLKIPDGGEVTVIYRGFKEVEDQRNPGEMKIRYILELDGRPKWFESKSGRIALIFDTIEEGEEVVISKTGEGFKTRYEVEVPGRENVKKPERKKK